ncbi:MAG: VWA domain-containing protein [Acidobacteria bacterium]|nr:VWA domain-containing protein [Acidobacteriota bacterium]
MKMRRKRWMGMAVGAVTAAVVATALLAGVSAQQRIRQAVIFDMVRLSAVVTDGDGLYVSGLDTADFQVFEDGVEQQIQIFNAPDSPITFAVLVDGSVSIATRLPTVRLSVRELLRNLGPRDAVQMVQFNERVSVLESFSTRRDALEAAIDSFSAAGGTAVLNAVYRGLREIEARAREERDESRRRAVVLLSDGVDSSSLISEDVVLSEARRSRASVYSVSLGQNLSARLTAGARGARGTALLEELGRTTGGRVIVPASADELQAAFAQVAEELRHQYGLAYVSDNVRRDGRWRRIELRVRNRPDLSVRHREGYYAGS